MKVSVILNPQANRGDAGRQIPAVTQALAAADLDYRLVVVQARGQAKREAIAAVSNCDVVVAAGGDGTVSEVVNGLIASAEEESICPLGVLPLGAGNNLSALAGISQELTAAVQVVASGKIRKVDLGWLSYNVADGLHDSNGAWRGQFFANNCTLAMGPLVSARSNRITFWLAELGHAVTALPDVLRRRARRMRVSWDNNEHEGPTFLLSLANMAPPSGLFAGTRGAQIDDGLFDFVLALEMSPSDVLQILARLVRGRQIDHPKIICGRTKRLWVKCRPGTPIHVDGELLAQAATTVHCQVLPGKISLCVP